jgi:hypothetical protein
MMLAWHAADAVVACHISENGYFELSLVLEMAKL